MGAHASEFIQFPSNDAVTRVAFAGDWHANPLFARMVIRSLAGGVDAVVHLGDFGVGFSDRYLQVVDEAAREADLVVMFVDGNHEDHAQLGAIPISSDGVRRLAPRVWHLPRGFRWEWSGLSFLALGGAHSVDRQSRVPGVSWWPQEAISLQDALRATEGGPVDVIVTHDAPAGHVIPGLMPPGTFPAEEIEASDAHRQVLRRVVDEVRPRALWHGHYHSRYRVETDYGCIITGLDCDGYGESGLHNNIDIVDLSELAGTLSSPSRGDRREALDGMVRVSEETGMYEATEGPPPPMR